VFSNTLDSGAFGLSPSLYTIESQDGVGLSPTVNAALIVPGAGTNVELALDVDLVQGGQYRITAEGVPATDLSVTPPGTGELFRFGTSQRVTNAEPSVSDWEKILYGTDLVWTGTDFQETASGDLATESGVPVICGAILRRVLSDGLPWDAAYGAQPREYVDGTLGNVPNLRVALLKQVTSDDRVKSVTVDLVTDEDRPDQTFFQITPTLIGNHIPTPINYAVPR